LAEASSRPKEEALASSVQPFSPGTQDALKEFDSNEDGRLNKQETATWAKVRLARAVPEDIREQYLLTVYDLNNNGKMDKNELEAHDRLGTSMSKKAFFLFDRDKDGELDPEEM